MKAEFEKESREFDAEHLVELIWLERTLYDDIMMREPNVNGVFVPVEMVRRIGVLRLMLDRTIRSTAEKWDYQGRDRTVLQVSRLPKLAMFDPSGDMSQPVELETEFIEMPPRGSKWRTAILELQARAFLIGQWEKEAGVKYDVTH